MVLSTVFSLVDEDERQGHAGWEESRGRWVWRAREQSGLHTDVRALVEQLRRHTLSGDKVKVDILWWL